MFQSGWSDQALIIITIIIIIIVITIIVIITYGCDVLQSGWSDQAIKHLPLVFQQGETFFLIFDTINFLDLEIFANKCVNFAITHCNVTLGIFCFWDKVSGIRDVILGAHLAYILSILKSVFLIWNGLFGILKSVFFIWNGLFGILKVYFWFGMAYLVYLKGYFWFWDCV